MRVFTLQDVGVLFHKTVTSTGTGMISRVFYVFFDIILGIKELVIGRWKIRTFFAGSFAMVSHTVHEK